MEWTPVRPEALHSSVRPGDAVKFQSTHEVEVGFFINSVTVAPTPGGALQRLVSARLGDAIRYYEVSTDWELFVRRESPEECQRREGEEEDEEAQREKNRAWPRCMKQNLFAKGEGIFLNLALFGIQQGCFQDDCSHSDHFTTESAAVCAEVCRVVPACKFWSVTVSATTTCWLRSATIKAFVDSPRSLAADTTCHPPTLDQSSSPARAEDNAPTLFDKLRSKPLRHPRAAEALKLHGLQTLAQIQAAPDSLLRQVAIQLYELR